MTNWSSILFCIFLTLITYRKNASILENFFENNNNELNNAGKSLQKLGLITSISFILGIIFFLVYVGFFIYYSYQNKNVKGDIMSNKKIVIENLSNFKKTIPSSENSGSQQNKQNKDSSSSTPINKDSSNSNNQKK